MQTETEVLIDLLQVIAERDRKDPLQVLLEIIDGHQKGNIHESA